MKQHLKPQTARRMMRRIASDFSTADVYLTGGVVGLLGKAQTRILHILVPNDPSGVQAKAMFDAAWAKEFPSKTA